MPYRKKILILEHDDFLREIIGNLLHKRGGYILNGDSLENGLAEAQNHQVDTVIVGNSCPDFKGKQSINFIEKTFNRPEIFLINKKPVLVDYLPEKDQFLIKELSVKKILDTVLTKENTA